LLVAIQDIPEADVFLLIDGDGTIFPNDTGRLFFEKGPGLLLEGSGKWDSDPLKTIHSRYSSYQFRAFFEVAMLYAKMGQLYQSRSNEIGTEQVDFHSSWTSLLQNLPANVHAVLVSCSNREIWKTAVAKHKLESKLTVIAGNHLELHEYIVDSHAKLVLSKELRKRFVGCKLLAFGDSALDIPMLKESDRGYIVVDSAKRNRSMGDFLQEACTNRKLFQLIDVEAPGSDFFHNGIQVGSLTSLMAELQSGSIHTARRLDIICPASVNVLATATRNAENFGPALQAIHERVGMLLADKLVEEYPTTFLQYREFPHVAGGTFMGAEYDGSNTVILPLMRGGEPMARGVYQRLPKASFIHFYEELPPRAEELMTTRTQNVILVDSVINKGDSMRRALDYLARTIFEARCTRVLRIYVITGVMQQTAYDTLPLEYPRVCFSTLRVSKNQYTGKGGTDTGNRLFGTM
jgi:uracil phosphoribosyltransferase